MPDVRDLLPGFLNRFSIRNPFYAHFLSGLHVRISDRIPDIALGEGPDHPLVIWINPEMDRYLAEDNGAVFHQMEHEVLHGIFGHFTRSQTYPNSRLYHLAADLVVNQYAPPSPEAQGEITLATFSDLYLEPGRDIGYYYQRLESAWEALMRRVALLGEQEAARHPFGALFLGDLPAMNRHRFWPPATDHNLHQHPMRILLLGKFQDWLKKNKPDVLKEFPFPIRMALEANRRALQPQMTWKSILRKFAATSRRTVLRSTLHRPSKRYGANPGVKVRRKHRLFVGVDVSASIDKNLLSAFFREIHRLWKTGSDIRILEFDAAVQRQYPYRGILPESVTGRGDTDFNPVIDAVNTPSPPDALILFTDGLGAIPVSQTAVPLLWIISPPKNRTISPASFPGRVITMEIP